MHHHRSTLKNGCTTTVRTPFSQPKYLVTQKNVTLRSNLQKAALYGDKQGSPLSAHINFMSQKFVSSKVTVAPIVGFDESCQKSHNSMHHHGPAPTPWDSITG